MNNPSPNILEERADRRKLPIGIQTFRKIREENCYYPQCENNVDEFRGIKD